MDRWRRWHCFLLNSPTTFFRVYCMFHGGLSKLQWSYLVYICYLFLAPCLVYFLIQLSFGGDGFKRGDRRAWNYLLVSPILGEIPRKPGARGGSLYPLISSHLLLRSFLYDRPSTLEVGEHKLVFKFQITIGTSTTCCDMETTGWFIPTQWVKGIGGGNSTTSSSCSAGNRDGWQSVQRQAAPKPLGATQFRFSQGRLRNRQSTPRPTKIKRKTH
jgi:hypothetical protein